MHRRADRAFRLTVAAARAWGRLKVIACGDLCQNPRTRADFRARYGCDAPVKRPVAAVPCYACFGQTPTKTCACKGAGSIRLSRCPTSIVTPDTERMYRAYHWYREGILPVAGGYLAQATQFVQCVPFLDGLWNYFLGEEVD